MNLRLEIEVLEPLTISAEAVVSNEIGTLDYLPASTLRGSFFQHLREMGHAGRADAWLGIDGPSWSPGWPVARDGNRTIAAPKSFLRNKLKRGLSGALWNTLYQEPAGAGGAEIQWTRLGVRWLAVDGSGSITGAWSVPIESAMHVGLHYGRQAHRTGALFSRQEIQPGAKFWARVSGAPREIDEAVWSIGKRRSAGNGVVRVTARQEDRLEWPSGCVADNATEVTVQLLSDAIVPGLHGGRFRGLGEEEWKKILGVTVKVLGAASSSRQRSQWSDGWGLPRQPEVVIEAGSCWRLKSADAGFAAAIKKLGGEGLGVRRYEGFGWVAVNPAWLQLGSDGASFTVAAQSVDAPTPRRGAAQWPGLEGEDAGELLKLAQRAGRLRIDAGLVQQLENHALRAATREEVLTFAKHMAERKNPGMWEDFWKKMEPELPKDSSLGQLRFFLLALANRHKGGARA